MDWEPFPENLRLGQEPSPPGAHEETNIGAPESLGKQDQGRRSARPGHEVDAAGLENPLQGKPASQRAEKRGGTWADAGPAKATPAARATAAASAPMHGRPRRGRVHEADARPPTGADSALVELGSGAPRGAL